MTGLLLHRFTNLLVDLLNWDAFMTAKTETGETKGRQKNGRQKKKIAQTITPSVTSSTLSVLGLHFFSLIPSFCFPAFLLVSVLVLSSRDPAYLP